MPSPADLPTTAQEVREFIYGVGVRYEMGTFPTDSEFTDMRVLLYRLADFIQEAEWAEEDKAEAPWDA